MLLRCFLSRLGDDLRQPVLAHKSEMLDRSVELDDIGTALFDQLDARLQRAADALLQRSEVKVATDERA